MNNGNPNEKQPFELDISFDDSDFDTIELRAILEETPRPKGEIYFSNPPSPRKPQAPPPPRKAKKRHSGIIVLGMLAVSLALSIALSIVAIGTMRDILATGRQGDDITVEIPADQSTDQIIDILHGYGLVRQRTLCKLFMRFTPTIKEEHITDSEMEYVAGPYSVNPSMGLEELLEEFKARLNEMIKPMVKVENIMTSPVMAISPDSVVQEAYHAMLRFGHKALPVVDNGEVVGMMSRNDLDKAHMHGFDNAAIKDFMTEGVIVISSEASVNEAHRLMATYSFERLPVLKEGRLTEIVTRADLVRSLFQTQTYRSADRDIDSGTLWIEDISGLLESALPSEQKNLLKRIGKRAQELGMKAYIVGGVVRDILKGNRNVDLDIAVEGDAEIFVKSWNEPGCRSTVHGRYKTGTITFPDGNKVDIATARREFYEYAAAMPEVSSDSLKQDLGRRDFSINAMAVSLSEQDWGALLDFYGGRRDLKEGLLRVLHNLSFVEDPSRILRGVRIEQRLGLRFEDNTIRLIHSAIKGGLLAKLSGSRIRTELEIDFKERYPLKVAMRNLEFGVWEALFQGFRVGKAFKNFRRLQKFLPYAKKVGVNFKGMEWLAYMAAVLSESPGGAQSMAMDKLHFTPNERNTITSCLAAPAAVEQFIASQKTLKNSEVYLFLKPYDPVRLLYCMATVKRWQTRRWIVRHVLSFVPTKRELTGDDILKMGYKSGQWLGEILEAIKLERMDGNIKTRDEELHYVDENLMRR